MILENSIHGQFFHLIKYLLKYDFVCTVLLNGKILQN